MDVFYSRCLLCACTPADLTPHLHIFSEAGNHLQLADKINKYLNIQIDGELPQNVCSSCMEKLEVTHELVTCSQQARVTLLHIKQQCLVQEVKQEDYSDCSMIDWESSYQPDIENCMDIKANISVEQMDDSDSEDFEQSGNELAAHLDEEPTFNTECNSQPHISVDVLPAVKEEIVDIEQEPQLVLQEEEGTVTLDDLPEDLTPVKPKRTTVKRSKTTVKRNTKKRKKRAVVKRKPRKRKPRPAGVDAVNCEICNERVKHKYSLIKHKNEKHNMNLTFGCECGKQFVHLNKFTAHVRIMQKYGEHCHCHICGKSYAKSAYESHPCKLMPKREIRQQKNLDPVFCAMCHRKERHKFALLKHINTEHLDVLVAPVNYCCELCPKEFPRYRTFVGHLRHVHLPKVRCGQCGKLVKQVSMLKHMKKHAPQPNDVEITTHSAKVLSEMIEDYIIDMEPVQPQTAVEEPAMQSEVEVFNIMKCASCGFLTDTKPDLIEHMQVHLTSSTSDNIKEKAIDGRSKITKNLQCVECGIRYGDSKMFSWHQKNCHGSNAIVNILGRRRRSKKGRRKNGFQCNFCKSVFQNIEMAIKHLANTHRVRNFPFCCKFCRKSFCYTQIMKRHERTCKMRNNFNRFYNVYINRQRKSHGNGVKCRLCNKVFESENQMESHISTFHAVINLNYFCKRCDDSFSTLSQLKTHCRVKHPSSDTWHCDMCEAKFTNYSCLMNHKKGKHSCVAVPCHLCPAKYTNPLSLREHIMIKHSELEYTFACKSCDAKFTCQKYLRQHVYRVHLHPILHCAHCKYVTHNKDCLVKHITQKHPIVVSS